MRIEVKGRNLPVSEDLREHVAKRFRKVERQVSELAVLEIVVFEERNPAIADDQVAEATLHLKGVTLRARDASPDIMHSINLCADELHVQVKRHRDKRRKRREARAAAAQDAGAGPSVEAVEEAGVGEFGAAAEGSLEGPAEGTNSRHRTGISSAA
jgi:putative sigma-54 modulation protein